MRQEYAIQPHLFNMLKVLASLIKKKKHKMEGSEPKSKTFYFQKNLLTIRTK